MASKGKSGRRKKAASLSSMSASLLPHDLIFSILTRLPAISLIRFKTVCKRFNNLISSPKFIDLHRLQTANNPKYNSLIIHTVIPDDNKHLISRVNVSPNVASETQVISLLYPFPLGFDKIEIVGSTNGIVCLASQPPRDMIILWNPAIDQWKRVRGSKNKMGNGNPDKVCLGFCFDSGSCDLKIVRVVFSEEDYFVPAVEMYSSSKDSWKMIEIDFKFYVLSSKCMIVKGDLNFLGFVDDDTKSKLDCIKFDWRTERFEQLPYNYSELTNYIRRPGLPDYTGVLCVENSSHIWTPDEGVSSWSEKFTPAPLGMNVEIPLHCWKSGDILALNLNSDCKLALFYHKSSSLIIQADPNRVFSYTESLVRLKGMKPVKKGMLAG